MIRNNKYFSILTVDDFKKYMHNTIAYVDTTPNTDQWTFSATEEAAQIKNGTVRGFVKVPVGALKIGDTIEVEAEILNISGIKTKIGIDSDVQVLENQLVTTHGDQYQKITLKHLVTNNSNYYVTVGLFYQDIGEIKIRSIAVKVNTIIESKPIANSGSNSNGNFVQFEDGTMICYHKLSVLSTDIAAGGQMQYTWTFPVPFVSIYPIVNATFEAITSAIDTSANYIATSRRTNNLASCSVIVVHLNRTTGVVGGNIMVMAIGKWK